MLQANDFDPWGYFDSENNILRASSCDEPQNSGSGLKSEHTLGLPGLV
jgi:hypothetical protein